MDFPVAINSTAEISSITAATLIASTATHHKMN